ncbi:MAG: hypothetical protein H7301_15315, partial [Cryobacterium sp.]|nr:hypothetical protein [Oligoflexia bacterium]
ALEELERYQSGRQSVQFAAYTGTAGLVLVLASGILTDLFIDESRVSARRDVTRVLRWGGAGLMIGSVGFGLARLRSNEDHLQSAISKHNASAPDRPIEILFKAEF